MVVQIGLAKPGINERLNFKSILKGILISYIITVPFLMIFAMILTYTTFPEKFLNPAVFVTTVISLLVAGSTATRNIRSKGWLNGGIVGIIYMIMLYFIGSLIITNFAFNYHILSNMIMGVFIGAIGGIVGINLKKGTRMNQKLR